MEKFILKVALSVPAMFFIIQGLKSVGCGVLTQVILGGLLLAISNIGQRL